MKKVFKQALVLLALCSVLALSFTACEESDDTPAKKPTVTYTLSVAGINVAQGGTNTIVPVITASDSSSTAGITVTYAAKAATTLTITGNSVSAPAAAPLGAQNFTATAKNGSKTVATADFTITVVAAGTVTYSLSVANVNVAQSGTATVSPVLTASNGSTPSGITYTYAVKTGTSTLTFSGNTVTAPAAAPLGAQTWTATAKQGTETVATADFTITVVPAGTVTYSLTVAGVSVQQGGSATVVPTLTASDGSSTATGFTYSYAVKTGTTTLTVTGNTVTAPANAPTGAQTWEATAKKGAETVATVDFTITVTQGQTGGPTYTLTIATVSVQQGGSATVVPTLTASDSSDTTAISVTIAYADQGTNPFTISGLQISAASTVPTGTYDFIATAATTPPTTRNFNVTVTSIATRTVAVTVTLGEDPEAALEDGEVVWLAGGFQESGTSWATLLLTKQDNGTWTGSFSLPGNKTSIKFNVYADTSTTELGWGPEAAPKGEKDTPDLTSGVLNYTVTAWVNRPAPPSDDELFADPGFESASDWALSSTPWLTAGGSGTFWVDGDGRNGKCYKDDGAAAANQAITLYQDIDVTDKLVAGDVVTLSTYVKIQSDPSTYVSGSFALVCGAQTFTIADPGKYDNKKWDDVVQVSHDFTLTASDFVGGKLKAGLTYTPATTGVNTRADDFSLMKKE